MKSSLVSIMIHVLVIGLVISYGTRELNARPRPREHTLLFYPAPIHHVEHRVTTLTSTGPSCREMCMPADTKGPVPPEIPGVDVQLTDPTRPTGANAVDVWDGPSRNAGSADQGTTSGPLSADVVEVQVTPYPGAPTPRYPEAQREAGIEGEVTLEFVVDTTGRVERGSVRVLSSAADAFVVSVRDALAGTRYHPALVGGRRVRQLVRQGFVFSLTQH
jgi:protein TonB